MPLIVLMISFVFEFFFFFFKYKNFLGKIFFFRYKNFLGIKIDTKLKFEDHVEIILYDIPTEKTST